MVLAVSLKILFILPLSPVANKVFRYGILRFWEKYGRETVFSTLAGAGDH